MDRIGVQLDQSILDRQGLMPSSKGLISTTELIFYLANRYVNRVDLFDRTNWWSVPEKEASEGPLRNK